MNQHDRRSGEDLRSDSAKQITGERRSGLERRSRLPASAETPSTDHLALFCRRLKRAIRDDRGRSFFGVVAGEDHFTVHADVSRVLDWLEHASAPDAEPTISRPSLRKAIV
jgi:hypothetical protein